MSQVVGSTTGMGTGMGRKTGVGEGTLYIAMGVGTKMGMGTGTKMRSLPSHPGHKMELNSLRNKSTLKRTVNNKIVKPVVISKRFIFVT